MSFIFERKINYYETDKMGVVHHSNYIRYLEEARCDMLDYFKMHVTFDVVIQIKPFVKSFNGVRLTMGYNVTDKKTGNIVLTGETKHCFTDSNLKPINLKKAFPDFYNKFENLKND